MIIHASVYKLKKKQYKSKNKLEFSKFELYTQLIGKIFELWLIHCILPKTIINTFTLDMKDFRLALTVYTISYNTENKNKTTVSINILWFYAHSVCTNTHLFIKPTLQF